MELERFRAWHAEGKGAEAAVMQRRDAVIARGRRQTR